MRSLRFVCCAVLGAGPAFVSGQTTPSPALLVLNKADSTLAIVDPKTHQVTARIPTGPQPHEVAVSEDGRRAFVTNYGSGASPGSTLSVIDLVGRSETRVDLGTLRRPHGIWVSGGKVYFTAEESRVIARYDPATGKIDATFATNQDVSHMVMLNASGSRMFSSNMGSNTVNIFERTGKNSYMPRTVAVGAAPEALDLSKDEKELWTAHAGDGAISIIDVAARKVAATLPRLTRRPNRLKFTPDGKQVLVSDAGNGELVVLDAASRTEVKRLKLGSVAEGIQITPDGSRAYVALERDNQVAIVDLKTLTVAGRFSPGNGPDGMAWAERK